MSDSNLQRKKSKKKLKKKRSRSKGLGDRDPDGSHDGEKETSRVQAKSGAKSSSSLVELQQTGDVGDEESVVQRQRSTTTSRSKSSRRKKRKRKSSVSRSKSKGSGSKAKLKSKPSGITLTANSVLTNDWTKGPCECLTNFGTCLASCLMPCITLGNMVAQRERENEDFSFCNVCCQCTLGLWFYGALERTKTRVKYEIPGTFTQDCLCMLLWYPCALTQMEMEIELQEGNVVLDDRPKHQAMG